MRRDRFIHLALEHIFFHPKTWRSDARLALDEYRPELALLGQRLDGSLVERLLPLEKEGKELVGDGGGKGGEKFVGLGHGFEWKRLGDGEAGSKGGGFRQKAEHPKQKIQNRTSNIQ